VLTPWGITKGLTLDRLRLGSRTLEQLYAGLNPLGFFAPDNSQRLIYFDCTDSIDDQGHGAVSNAATGRAQSLTLIAHLVLLWDYIVNRKPDVHSGSFEPGFVGRLIYRFACIGYGDCEEAYGHFDAFSDLCQKHQVKGRASPSPLFFAKPSGSSNSPQERQKVSKVRRWHAPHKLR
jgi:hypothetical protein